MMASNILVILAGGSGVRYKAGKPKQYTTINGKELLEYSIDEMKQSEKTDKMLVVLNNDPETMERVRTDYDVEVLTGGKERAYSFQNALDYVKVHYPECKKISDSLGSYVMQAPRREDYYLIQAPEAYKFSVLNQYYDCDSDIYFAANQFPAFIKGYQYFDIQNNLKLTNPDDKVLIEYLLNKGNRQS